MRSTPLLVLLLACGPEAPTAPGDAAASLCPGCIGVGATTVDDDGDGFCEDDTSCQGGALPGDCDDGLAIAYPGAPERCDAIDRDCDGAPRDQFDLDEDGVCDDVDLCPHDADPTQADADADGVGDACDACPGIPGTAQGDVDIDGICDAVDPCVGPAGAPDADADGICDVAQLALRSHLDGGSSPPSIAWSETSASHLVLTTGGSLNKGLFAQRLGPTGVPLGPRRRIARASHPLLTEAVGSHSSVAWRAVDDTFLVVFTTAYRRHVLALRVAADGTPLEEPRIVASGGGHDSFDAPRVTWSAERDEFLVVMNEAVAHPMAWGHDVEWEVSALLLDGEGHPLMPSTRRLSFTGTTDTDWYQAYEAQSTWDATLDRWTVLWEARDAAPGGATGFSYLARVQQLDAQATPLSAPLDLDALSLAGVSQSAADVVEAAIAFDPTSRQYLLVWVLDGEDPRFGVEEREVWGRFLDDDLSLLDEPFPISRVHADGDPVFAPYRVRAWWEAKHDSFAVAWLADSGEGVMLENEIELYGQRITPDGRRLYPADQRLSQMGPDGAYWRLGTFEGAISTMGLTLVGDGSDPSHGAPMNTNQVWTWHLPWDGPDLDRDGTPDLRLCFGDDAFGDEDSDGICEDVDLCQGTDITGDTDLDGVCDDLDLCEGDDRLGDHNADGLCDPQLEVIGLAVGAPATLALSEAPPGTTARFFASRRGTTAPTCHPSLDVCLELRDNVPVGTTTVAADGTASVLFTPPPFAGPGRVLSFQAAWFDPVSGEGDTSAVVNATVQ